MASVGSIEGRSRSSPSVDHTHPSVASSGLQSDDSAFYAFGNDWDAPPQMEEPFAQFLHTKAGVTMDFLKEFEKAALVWNLKTFMRWFSMGTAFDVAKRFGIDFCLKHPAQIAKIGVLFQFLEEQPLTMEKDAPQSPDYHSFKEKSGGILCR